MWVMLKKATDLWDAKSGTQNASGDSGHSCGYEGRCFGMTESYVPD